MGFLPDHIWGRDIDDVFSYPTTKYVRIRDRRLGLVKLFLTLAVCLYVALYSLWYQGLYLEASPLTGACRFTCVAAHACVFEPRSLGPFRTVRRLQQPTVKDCDPTKARPARERPTRVLGARARDERRGSVGC